MQHDGLLSREPITLSAASKLPLANWNKSQKSNKSEQKSQGYFWGTIFHPRSAHFRWIIRWTSAYCIESSQDISFDQIQMCSLAGPFLKHKHMIMADKTTQKNIVKVRSNYWLVLSWGFKFLKPRVESSLADSSWDATESCHRSFRSGLCSASNLNLKYSGYSQKTDHHDCSKWSLECDQKNQKQLNQVNSHHS